MFYADYDEETDLYCIFNTETDKAYASYSTLEQAEQHIEEMMLNGYH